MRIARWIAVCVFVISLNAVYGQNILKIVKNYALIDINEALGPKVGEKVNVWRTSASGKKQRVGTVQIIKFAQDKCAAKIIKQSPGNPVRVGDYIEIPGLQTVDAAVDEIRPPTGDMGSVGIEKGDSEISFMGIYTTMLGTDFSFNMGSIKLSYGYFITDRIQIGAAPQWTIYQGYGGGTITIFGAAAFFNYSFNTRSKIIPYITGQWYQENFYQEEGNFFDDSYITFGGGFRNFFTAYAAMNVSASYGFCLGSEGDYNNIITILGGLSFIF